MEINIHIPEKSGIDGKALAVCLIRLMDICRPKLPVDFEDWCLDSDALETGVYHRFNGNSRPVMDIYEQYFSDYFMFYGRIIFWPDPNKKYSSTFSRSVNGCAYASESKRGYTVPKTENEKELRITIPRAIAGRIMTEELESAVKTISERYNGSYTFQLVNYRGIIDITDNWRDFINSKKAAIKL